MSDVKNKRKWYDTSDAATVLQQLQSTEQGLTTQKVKQRLDMQRHMGLIQTPKINWQRCKINRCLISFAQMFKYVANIHRTRSAYIGTLKLMNHGWISQRKI